MSEQEQLPEHWKELIEDYLDGLLDASGIQELEENLRADEVARRYFVRYARLHTDIHLEARACEAGSRALEQLGRLSENQKALASTATLIPPPARTARFLAHPMLRWTAALNRLGIAAGLLIVIGASWWLAAGWVGPSRTEDEPAIAWLVNAQDCTWSGSGPTGNLQSGKVLSIERGLAEIHFQCGARVVLEGPSVLELISSKSARLTSGRLTARVPASASGFEILSPQGKVIDLGTEFGILADKGSTEVYVFEGKVEALPAQDSPAEANTVSLTEHQGAQMAAGRVTIRPVLRAAAEGQFVRAIAPTPVIVPRTMRLTFAEGVNGSIKDRAGFGTGLTHRLPGTGKLLPEADGNLRLNTDKAQLELTTSNSDLNTQYKLDHGEYLGTRLADLGFTGTEDFAVTVAIPNIPALEVVGQFGLYAGVKSNCNIRGGLIGGPAPGQYTQFIVNNNNGSDSDESEVGLLTKGTDLRLTLKRIGGKYSLAVENLTKGSTSTLTLRHPDFLDGVPDLYVGLFGANTQSEVRKTLIFKDFQATVWKTATSTVHSGDAAPKLSTAHHPFANRSIRLPL